MRISGAAANRAIVNYRLAAIMRINATTVAVLLSVGASSCIQATRQVRGQAVGCALFPDREPIRCEIRSDGAMSVARVSLPHLSFDDNGLATVVVQGHDLYFVTRQGKAAPAFPFDNGPDYFVEGLARTVGNRKIGFVNRQLDTVISPAWDFAAPFDHGVAAVCAGCTPKSDGEHSSMAGGKWGYVDKHGAVVVAVTHELGELPSPEAAALLKAK